MQIKAKKPNSKEAHAVLEFIAMEPCRAKINMEALWHKEIQSFLKWIDDYAEKLGITQEEALNQIIEENK
jgi:hypothetical protein